MTSIDFSACRGACVAALLTIVALPLVSLSQTGARRDFNLFSTRQEIEIGRRSASEAEKHLPMLYDAGVNEYISRLGLALSARAPGERYPYSFKIADVSEINAYAFPGGTVFITRGTIEDARSEGALAGMIAHAIAHIALRHGASQASKAYLAQAGIGALGGIGDDGPVTNVVNAAGGFGLNTVFLNYSPEAESEADALCEQIMILAGYDPREMTNFFRALDRRIRAGAPELQAFIADHPTTPTTDDRTKRMELEQAPDRSAGDFHKIRDYVARLPRAQNVAPIARLGPKVTAAVEEESMEDAVKEDAPLNRTQNVRQNVRVERPSPQTRNYWEPAGSWFRLAYPENWRAHPSGDRMGVTLIPPGGVVEARGQTHLLYGAVVNRYRPIGDNNLWTGLRRRSFRLIGGRGPLIEATNDLLDSVLQNNPHLDFVRGSARGSDRRGAHNGSPAITLTLTGRAPLTGRRERAQLYACELADGDIVYAIFVAPDEEYDDFRPAFERMLRGLKIDGGSLRRNR